MDSWREGKGAESTLHFTGGSRRMPALEISMSREGSFWEIVWARVRMLSLEERSHAMLCGLVGLVSVEGG